MQYSSHGATVLTKSNLTGDYDTLQLLYSLIESAIRKKNRFEKGKHQNRIAFANEHLRIPFKMENEMGEWHRKERDFDFKAYERCKNAECIIVCECEHEKHTTSYPNPLRHRPTQQLKKEMRK
jgi:hypothetical protein